MLCAPCLLTFVACWVVPSLASLPRVLVQVLWEKRPPQLQVMQRSHIVSVSAMLAFSGQSGDGQEGKFGILVAILEKEGTGTSGWCCFLPGGRGGPEMDVTLGC